MTSTDMPRHVKFLDYILHCDKDYFFDKKNRDKIACNYKRFDVKYDRVPYRNRLQNSFRLCNMNLLHPNYFGCFHYLFW